ncbi:hypothetical protein [Acinetobacter courvalinii]|uniref:hypothetical protein n=1 Tax=Acinetobacter courvalinii TaxID=280147 RepID=UPI0002D119F9|nr:hypothetical protein [Acinetobacter courvalinii]ENX05681.1 hypothetical protein F898_02625 [Acinetobacter courvalinii]
MHLQISKLLFSILVITVLLSVLLLLRPDISSNKNREIQPSNITHLDENAASKSVVAKHSAKPDLNNIWIREIELQPFFSKKELAPQKVKKQREPKISAAPIYIAPVVQPVTPTPQFNYVGRLIEGNQETLFLMGPAGPFIAKHGDVIDGQWRIEQISANSIDMTYLNTDTNFRLNIK